MDVGNNGFIENCRSQRIHESGLARTIGSTRRNRSTHLCGPRAARHPFCQSLKTGKRRKGLAGNLLTRPTVSGSTGMLRFLIRQSAALAFIEALALLFAISWLDLATGHQVSLVLFYTAPILFAVWLCDNKSVFVIAGLAGVLWSWADLALGHSYSNADVQAWEIAIRFAFFFLVGLAGIAMRERQSASSARIELLEHTQKLEKQIIEVSEYEQQRIGRDLHDGLCQFLAAIGCAATSLKMDLEEKRLRELASKAGEIENLLGESVKQARDLSHGLIPVQLNDA